MGLILDSSLLIAKERGKFDLAGFLATRNEPIALAAITASELLHGCHRAMTVQQKVKRTEYVEWVLSKFEVVPFALPEARQHARIWAELAAQGKSVGSNDLLIAATALSLGFTVATGNVREFSYVPGLSLVDEGELSGYRFGP